MHGIADRSSPDENTRGRWISKDLSINNANTSAERGAKGEIECLSFRVRPIFPTKED
jgi:hypothetical protein